jgi:adenylate cyclase
VFAKISDLLEAQHADLYLVDQRRDQLRPVIAAGTPPRDIAERAARTGQILNVPGSGTGSDGPVLCVPIHNRHEELCAVAQLRNKKRGGPFTRADERAFRDFATPLGMILEGCERLARNPES